MSRQRRRVLYLTCTEIIASHGLFETQVKALLETLTQEHGDAVQMHLLSLVPCVRFRKWAIEWVFAKNRGDFGSICRDLRAAGVECRILPLMAAYPFLSMRPLELLLALPLALFQVLTYVRRRRIDLLHCRSYPAGLVAYLVQCLIGIPYIFDPRSLWIEEQVLNANWGGRSLSHWFWRRLEAAIVRHAGTTVVVSDPMAEPYHRHSTRVEVIYTTASRSFFEPTQSYLTEQDTERLEELRNLGNHHKLLVFVTNRFNKWNDLGYLLRGYSAIRTAFECPRLVLLTRTPQEVIRREAHSHGIPEEEIWIGEMGSEGVAVALHHCHYGLLIRPVSALSPIVMSVKFAEYLASGLPVLCDAHIGGAAHVVRAYGVGVLLSGDPEADRAALGQMQAAYPQVAKRCQDVARSHFSVDTHANRYARLYQEVLS